MDNGIGVELSALVVVSDHQNEIWIEGSSY